MAELRKIGLSPQWIADLVVQSADQENQTVVHRRKAIRRLKRTDKREVGKASNDQLQAEGRFPSA